MKEEDEKGEEAEKVGKNWADGEVHYLITLRGEMEFEFTKNTKKQGKFKFIKTLEKKIRFDFCFVFIIETWM
jgi:hypothetical protein